MQIRPDMTVFSPQVDGRFNLYRFGDRRLPNDEHKLKHIQSLIEVKGSLTASKLAPKAFSRQIASDIDKLAGWRERLATGSSTGQSNKASYVMLVVESQQKRLPLDLRESLKKQAVDSGVILRFVPH